MKGMILWVAQGFGAGRVPVAPGTFGSLLGLLWFGALLPAGDLWVYVAGTVAGIAAARCELSINCLNLITCCGVNGIFCESPPK